MGKFKLLILSALCVFLNVGAETSQQLQQEIDDLEKQIYDHKVHESNLNIDSQQYMFGQPDKYAAAMKRIEEIDKEIDGLEKRIGDLKAEHDKLLKDVKPPQS